MPERVPWEANLLCQSQTLGSCPSTSLVVPKSWGSCLSLPCSPQPPSLCLLVIAGAVGVNTELVANDSAGPGFPLETGHMDRQDLGTDEALVEQGEPVVLGGRGESQQHNGPPPDSQQERAGEAGFPAYSLAKFWVLG